MNKLGRNTLALGLSTLLITSAAAFSANAADETESHATSRFLSGTIGGTNLDAIAELEGTSADNPGDPGPNTNPLSLTVLQAIPINIPGGLDLNLADFLSPGNGSAGVANHYAAAPQTNSAAAASGAVNDTGAILAPGNGEFPSNAKISLDGGLLNGINDELAGVDLSLGALSGSAVIDKGDLTRDYQIGSATLDVKVPLLADLTGDLSTALKGLDAANDITISPASLCPVVGNTLNVTTSTLLAQLDSLGLGAVGDALEPVLTLLGVSNLNLCNLPPQIGAILTNETLAQLVTVQVKGLADVTSGIANFSSDGVAVDLATGTISLDLAKILQAAGVDINNLPPNTDLVQYITSDLIAGKITNVLNNAIDDIVTNIGKVSLQVTVAGTTVIPESDLGALTDPLTAILQQVTDAVQQIGAPIDDLLGDLAPDLARIVKLTANTQSTSTTPTLSAGGESAGVLAAAATGTYYRQGALRVDRAPFALVSSARVSLAERGGLGDARAQMAHLVVQLRLL